MAWEEFKPGENVVSKSLEDKTEEDDKLPSGWGETASLTILSKEFNNRTVSVCLGQHYKIGNTVADYYTVSYDVMTNSTPPNRTIFGPHKYQTLEQAVEIMSHIVIEAEETYGNNK